IFPSISSSLISKKIGVTYLIIDAYGGVNWHYLRPLHFHSSKLASLISDGLFLGVTSISKNKCVL
ncbi:unnamed protein product, partial [Sphenostylis stenocarpa]